MLQKDSPFFSYLLQHMKIIKDETIETIGVNGNLELAYNEKFINSLEETVVENILIHEISHITLLHPERVEGFFKKNKIGTNEFTLSLMNVALDLAVNDILVSSGIEVPRKIKDMEFVVPENHEFNFHGYLVKDINKKSAEDIYLELIKHLKKEAKKQGKQMYKGIDTHDKMSEGAGGYKDKEGKGKGKESTGKNGGKNEVISQANGLNKKAGDMKKKIEKLVVEAAEFERMKRGTLPAGLERIVGKIVEPPKINWRSILKNEISSQLPSDFSYSRPHRKSFATGFYLPSVKREGLSVVISIDTSGSINASDLKDFLTEIVGIAKSFNNVDMRVITADCKVYDDYEVKNGNIDKIMKIKLKGGGGTSHLEVFEHIKKNHPQTRLYVGLTDGWSNIPEIKKENYNFKTIWVITKGGQTNLPFGRIIELK